jgi:hypothetical protein
MFAGTHALLPVCGCLAFDHASMLAGRGRVFPARSMWWVAGFGLLPDLCSPHLSLEARYNSLSHTIWFGLAALPMAAVAASFMESGVRWRVAVVCWLAVMLHLVADAVSGGIAWLHPWRGDIIGAYYIHPSLWIWSDAGFVFLTWLLLRVAPHLEGRLIRLANPPR